MITLNSIGMERIEQIQDKYKFKSNFQLEGHDIYGKLNRGEIETKVEEYCKSVELSEIEKQSQMSVGAAMVRKMIESYEKSLQED